MRENRSKNNENGLLVEPGEDGCGCEIEIEIEIERFKMTSTSPYMVLTIASSSRLSWPSPSNIDESISMILVMSSMQPASATGVSSNEAESSACFSMLWA